MAGSARPSPPPAPPSPPRRTRRPPPRPRLRGVPQRARRLQRAARPPAGGARRHGCRGRCGGDRAAQPVRRRPPSRTPAGRTSSGPGPAGSPPAPAPCPRRCRRPRRSTVASTTLSKPRKRATNASAGRCHTSSGRAGLGDPAVPHHHDPVGERERLALVVGDGEHRGAQPAEQLAAVRRRAARAAPRSSWPSGSSSISSRGRGRERAGQRDALLLTAGQRGDGPPLRRRAARPGRAARRPGARCSARGAPRIRSPKATLPPTSRCGKSWWSWNISPTPRRCAGTPAWSAPVQQHPPGVQRLEPGDRPQQRGLAAAAGPEHAHDLVLGDVQVDRVERGAARRTGRSRVRRSSVSRRHQNSPDPVGAEALQHQQRHRAHHHQDRLRAIACP